jgi:DNA-binding transcriptional MerR regulator
MKTPTHDLKTLCTLAGSDVTPRTVHYYIQQGLLPHATTGGAKASYDQRHLSRLRLIKRLQRQHLPLAEIRERLGRMTDEDVERALEEPSSCFDPGSAPGAGSALEYVRRALGMATEASEPTPPRSVDLNCELAPRHHQAQAATEPPASWNRSQWDRIALTQDFELQVRRPLTREGNRKLERLLEAARAILEEEK